MEGERGSIVPTKWFTAGAMTCGQCGAPWGQSALTCASCGARAGRRIVIRQTSIPPLAMLLILLILGSLAVLYTIGLWNSAIDVFLPPHSITGTVTLLTPQGHDLYALTIGRFSAGYLDPCAGQFLKIGDRVVATYSAGNHLLYRLQVTSDAQGTPIANRIIYDADGTGLCPTSVPIQQVRLINIAVGGAICLALDILTLALGFRWGLRPLLRRLRSASS
jgi:hypothetical protein